MFRFDGLEKQSGSFRSDAESIQHRGEIRVAACFIRIRDRRLHASVDRGLGRTFRFTHLSPSHVNAGSTQGALQKSVIDMHQRAASVKENS